MTETSMPLIELLQKQDDGDFLRTVAEAVLQLLMEHDVEGLVGAGRYERGESRLTWRNGCRDREAQDPARGAEPSGAEAAAGVVLTRLPRAAMDLGEGAGGRNPGSVDRRRLDELVQAMGLSGISKSTVSKLCKQIDERVRNFLDRPLTGEWPYLWLDATYLKVR
jgi:putative transposase